MIINYLITNVNAKREDVITPDMQVGVAHNVSITNIEKDEKFKILKFTFKFDAVFSGSESKELGKIVIEGVVVYTGGEIEKIYDQWAEDKKMETPVAEEIFQASLNIGILEAMSIAKQMQLPSLLPLPKVSATSNPQEESKDDEHRHEKKSNKPK